MLPLCGALQITVNDLLTGAVVSETDYRKRAEENMMNLMKENEENKRRMMLSVLCGAITIVAVCALVALAAFAPLPAAARIALLLLALASLRPPCSTHRPATTSARTAARFSRRRSANT